MKTEKITVSFQLHAEQSHFPHSGCAQLGTTAVKGNLSFRDGKRMWRGVGVGLNF